VNVVVCETKRELGVRAAGTGAGLIRRAIGERGRANIIVATGASQFEILAALAAADGVEWDRVTAFHLDEYAGMPISHPASFRKYLKERFVDPLTPPPAAFHYIDGEGDCRVECDRLGELIGRHPIDVALVGIGENGHLAFNDPPADFETDEPYLVVNLDEACRRQQVGEGWFDAIAAAELGAGQYTVGGEIVEVSPDGRAARPGHANLVGSTLTLDKAVVNVALHCDVPFEQAWAMASTRPARLAGLDGPEPVTVAVTQEGFDRR